MKTYKLIKQYTGSSAELGETVYLSQFGEYCPNNSLRGYKRSEIENNDCWQLTSIDISKRTKGEWVYIKDTCGHKVITNLHHTETIMKLSGFTFTKKNETPFYDATDQPGITNEEAEANAAFIVKACNNHDKLIEALKRIAKKTTQNKGVGEKLFEIKEIALSAIQSLKQDT